MHIVQVNIFVKPECVEAFRAATIENSKNSLKEPGIARFDVLQDVDNPAHFVLIEAYRTKEAMPAHKETAHYAKWAETVNDMFAEPRTRALFTNVHPGDSAWGAA